jgi:hypothetical protein
MAEMCCNTGTWYPAKFQRCAAPGYLTSCRLVYSCAVTLSWVCWEALHGQCAPHLLWSMESCISLHQRHSSQKGGRLDLSFHPQIDPKKNSQSLKPDCIMYAADSKFDICGRNTILAVHNEHLYQYLWSGHETEVQCTYLTMYSLAWCCCADSFRGQQEATRDSPSWHWCWSTVPRVWRFRRFDSLARCCAVSRLMASLLYKKQRVV